MFVFRGSIHISSISENLRRSYPTKITSTSAMIFPITCILTLIITIDLIQPYGYAAFPSFIPILASHMSPSAKAINSPTTKQIRHNNSFNYSGSDLRKPAMKKSRSRGGIHIHVPSPVRVVTFLRGLVISMHGNVAHVYRRIRHKSDVSRMILEKRIGLAAETVFNASKLITHAEPNEDEKERYGDLAEDIALSMAYLSNDDKFWQFINEEQGIRVWKTRTPLCDDKNDKKWVCIMTKTTIPAPAAKLRKLLLDSEKVTLLNRYSCGRTDVEIIHPHCKVAWARSRIPYTIKPFDFCTLIRDYCDPKTGMILIISKAVDHELAPITKEYARSHVIFGLNVLIPSPDNPDVTQFISISHVKYGGIYPAIVSSGAYQGSVNYVQQLRSIAPGLIKDIS